jgi:hypothetical protein
MDGHWHNYQLQQKWPYGTSAGCRAITKAGFAAATIATSDRR